MVAPVTMLALRVAAYPSPMPSLTFEGDTHAEIVEKVRRWLASAEAPGAGRLTAVEAVEQGAELTKEALRVIAAAAPAPVADSELLKALTDMGYKATRPSRPSSTGCRRWRR